MLQVILFGDLSINLLQLSHVHLPIFGVIARMGLTTPLTRQVARCCYLCAGAVHVVLRGSPTGSITLFSSLREISTVAVLHHPFLFGENTDADKSHQERISGAIAGETSSTSISRITLFAICLSFSSPPLHKNLSFYPPSFSFVVFSSGLLFA